MHRALALLLTIAIPAYSEALQVAWANIPEYVGNRTIRVVRPDGSIVRGKVQRVESDALHLDSIVLRRAEVTTFQMAGRRSRGQALGTAIGAGAGVAMAVPAHQYYYNEGRSIPLLLAILVVAPAIAGFFIGRSWDRRPVTVTVM